MWPKQSFLGSISAHLLLWTTCFCSGAINNFHYSGFGFTWLSRQGDVFYPSLAPEEALLLQTQLGLLLVIC